MSEQLITVGEFCKMVGHARNWFYRHMREPGMPQRVYPAGGEARLVLSECLAYVEGLKSERPPEGPPKRRKGRPLTRPAAPASPPRP